MQKSLICTKSKAFRSLQIIARRKLRKMLAYKYWKAAPNLKEYEYSKSGKVDSVSLKVTLFVEEGVKPLYHTRKIGYRFEISQHNTLFKRRKFFDRGSVLTSDGGFSNDSVSNLPEKGMDRASHIASSKLHELIVYTLYAVKFSIKSFKIPELYIDVLKTETIGSLKRTVMEAVMTLFGSGMLVGALVQGKKVRDDNRTLLQMCLCSKEKLNKLGITLEPNSIQDSPADCLDDPSHYETSHPIRSPETPIQDSGTTHGYRICLCQ
ncbi:telomere repeat-binding protein 3-like [Arachis ipaensis]|uniref:telomere repeat-binding protein 3-like n=1 Tax=Arachis ipaensis TaxID=130454 RepID=UPI000A2B0FF6|nr:telomere repeat-binding protein 3-like [Arachis ipaensis]